MTASDANNRRLPPGEIISAQQALMALRAQVQSGSVDLLFLARQIDRLDALLARVEQSQQIQHQEGRFEALYNVSRLIGSSLDLQTVLDQVIDAIISLTGAERGFLMLRDDDGGLAVKVARNFDQQTLSAADASFSRTIVNQVLDSGKPIVTTNAAEDPRFAQKASIVMQALRSVMATPLRARGSVMGVAYVDNKVVAGLFTEGDLAALDTLVGQAAVAIDNALLFSATDQELALRLEELRQLRRVDRLLNETLDARTAMQHTLEWACRLSEASTGHLSLLDGDPPALHTAYHYGVPPGTTQPLNLEERFPQVREVLAQRHSVTAQAGDAALLIVPITREQKAVGAVILRRTDGRAFTPNQQDIVERVVDRAAVAIENARLYAAVQAADRAKSEFVGIVAHDLKAPMTGIAGYADLLLMTASNLDARQLEYLNRIKNTEQRMEVLVSDLADISRIESGHFFMRELRVSVADIVSALKDTTMPQIEARGHTLVERIEPGLPDMWVDYYRLLQVLTNLLTNAYKYTPDGGTITLGAAQRDGRIHFSVTDTGIGMSRDDLARLGTKFWRAEDSFTRSQPGTGLGFAITRALVEQMGSAIIVTSAVGQGSTFAFSVPVAES
jgi:signal transduction histidine kinase